MVSGSVAGSNSARTVSRPEPIVVVHVGPEPVHPPLQPRKIESVAGVAVSATMVCGTNAPVHVSPVAHAMPDGDDVTEPLPSPVNSTASEVDTGTNTAVTEMSVAAGFAATAHVAAVPSHAPIQPASASPALRRRGQRDGRPAGDLHGARPAAAHAMPVGCSPYRLLERGLRAWCRRSTVSRRTKRAPAQSSPTSQDFPCERCKAATARGQGESVGLKLHHRGETLAPTQTSVTLKLDADIGERVRQRCEREPTARRSRTASDRRAEAAGLRIAVHCHPGHVAPVVGGLVCTVARDTADEHRRRVDAGDGRGSIRRVLLRTRNG